MRIRTIKICTEKVLAVFEKMVQDQEERTRLRYEWFLDRIGKEVKGPEGLVRIESEQAANSMLCREQISGMFEPAFTYIDQQE